MNYLRKTKLTSIVPPVAIAEMNLNITNNSNHGINALINPVNDCNPIAIIKGFFLPILKITNIKIQLIDFFNYIYIINFFFVHFIIIIFNIPISHYTKN